MQFDCSTCGEAQRILRFKEQVRQEEALCPACGSLRTPLLVSTIAEGSPLGKLALRELGLPDQEILAFENGDGRHYVQIES